MKPIRGTVIENSAAVLLARVENLDGDILTQGDITEINVRVYDMTSGDLIGSPFQPPISSTIFDTLQTDERWREDDEGYNAAIVVDGSYFPEGDTIYRVEVQYVSKNGPSFGSLWDLQCVNTYGD